MALLPRLAAFSLPVLPLSSPHDFFWVLELAAKVAACLWLVSSLHVVGDDVQETVMTVTMVMINGDNGDNGDQSNNLLY